MTLFYKHSLKGIAFWCFLLCASLHVGATTYTLNTGSNTNLSWYDASIWLPNGVPGADDDVIINGTETTALITNGDITVKSLTINSLAYIFGPGTMTVTENLDTRYPLYWQMRLVIAAGATATMTDVNFSNFYTGVNFYYELVVDGNLVIEAQSFSGTKVFVNGTLTQKEGSLNASIVVNPGGVLNINSPNFKVDLGRIDNKGTFNWQNGELRSVSGPIINSGLWNIQTTNGLLTFEGLFQDTVIYNSGSIQIASNVNSVSMNKKMVNVGTINMAGASTLSLLALDHFGAISGPAGATLSLSGNYFGTSNTLYSGSSINVPSFKTTNSTSLAIKSGADISSIQNFFFDQGSLELGVVLPPAATYQIRATVQTDVNQSFTGVFLLEGGSFDGNCSIDFNTPNLTVLSGYFGGFVQVYLSPGTILTVKSMGVSTLVNDGLVNWQQNGYISSSLPGVVNNGIWNMEGDSLYLLGYSDGTALTYFKNNGVMNFKHPVAQFSTSVQNYSTINISSNSTFQVIGELQHFGTITGQTDSKLSLNSSNTAHTFHPGAQTSNLKTIEMNYGKAIFKLGTIFNNITQFEGYAATLETRIVLPPAAQYIFKKSLIRLNTQFEPTTILELEDTNIEGSGNIRIGNGMNWNGGIMDVPLRVYDNALVNIQENEERPIISAPFTNEGDITLSGGIIEINTGFFKNAGNWNVDSDLDVIMDGFTSFTNDGNFSICGDQPIKISFNVPFINNASGTFKGDGSYTFNAGFSNEGTIAPGCSPGVLTIEDNLEAPNVVQIEVTGGNAGAYDQLLVNGNMSAGGLLDIIVPPGASLNGSIKIIETSGAFTGTFSQVNIPPNFSLQYLPDGVMLTSDGTVGTSELSKEGIQVVPTLADTRIVLNSNQILSADAQIELYHLSGQLVRRVTWNQGALQQEISVENLPNGTYFLRMNQLPTWNQRIVVQHN